MLFHEVVIDRVNEVDVFVHPGQELIDHGHGDIRPFKDAISIRSHESWV